MRKTLVLICNIWGQTSVQHDTTQLQKLKNICPPSTTEKFSAQQGPIPLSNLESNWLNQHKPSGRCMETVYKQVSKVQGVQWRPGYVHIHSSIQSASETTQVVQAAKATRTLCNHLHLHKIKLDLIPNHGLQRGTKSHLKKHSHT